MHKAAPEDLLPRPLPVSVSRGLASRYRLFWNLCHVHSGASGDLGFFSTRCSGDPADHQAASRRGGIVTPRGAPSADSHTLGLTSPSSCSLLPREGLAADAGAGVLPAQRSRWALPRDWPGRAEGREGAAGGGEGGLGWGGRTGRPGRWHRPGASAHTRKPRVWSRALRNLAGAASWAPPWRPGECGGRVGSLGLRRGNPGHTSCPCLGAGWAAVSVGGGEGCGHGTSPDFVLVPVEGFGGVGALVARGYAWFRAVLCAETPCGVQGSGCGVNVSWKGSRSGA